MKFRIIVFMMLSLLAFSACKSQGDVVLSWGSTDIRYEQDAMPGCLSDEAFRFTAWRGERVSAQAVLWTPHDVNRISVRSSALYKGLSIIPARMAEASVVRYVMADELGEGYRQCGARGPGQYDSLLVADILGDPVIYDVKGGSCVPIWLSIDVPQDASAGTYRGDLVVRGDGFGKMTLPFTLKVSQRRLPEASRWDYHLDLWQNPYSVARYHDVPLWSEEHFEYMKPLMKKLASAGQKVVTATIMDRPWNGQTEDAYGSMVRKIRKADGSWEYDYEVFDRWVKFMFSMGIDRYISCYSMIPWRLEFDYFDEASGRTEYFRAGPDEEEYRSYWIAFLTDFASHLKSEGWFDKTVIAMDERPAEAMKAVFDVIRQSDSGFKVSLAGEWHPEIEEDLFDYCVAFRESMPDSVRIKRASQGKITTFYTCCAEKYPNTFVASHPAEAVWISWHSLSRGLDGYLRWSYNHWTKDPVADARFRKWPAGDCYCIYPDAKSSIRMERLIEGIQDYEKAKIMINGWKEAGDTVRIERFREALSRFDYETITEEGPVPALEHAKMFLE